MLSTFLGIIIGLIFAVLMTIIPVRKYLKPAAEKAFYTWILPPIVLIYIGFSVYYQDLSVLPAEILGVLIFTGFAVFSHFFGICWLVCLAISHTGCGTPHVGDDLLVGRTRAVSSGKTVDLNIDLHCVLYPRHHLMIPLCK